MTTLRGEKCGFKKTYLGHREIERSRERERKAENVRKFLSLRGILGLSLLLILPCTLLNFFVALFKNDLMGGLCRKYLPLASYQQVLPKGNRQSQNAIFFFKKKSHFSAQPPACATTEDSISNYTILIFRTLSLSTLVGFLPPRYIKCQAASLFLSLL